MTELNFMNLNQFQFIKNTYVFYAKATDIIDGMPYSEISDAMIEKYLTNQDFICTLDGNHRGIYDSLEHHAQRIASLIHLIQTNVDLKPVVIYCKYINDETARVMGIDDGWHRLRASTYLDKQIKFYLDFNE